MHFLDKLSLDNELIIVHRKLGQKLGQIALVDFENLHNPTTQMSSYFKRYKKYVDLFL